MSVLVNYIDVLQNIEAMIVRVYREHDDLKDSDVIEGLEELSIYYKNKNRGIEREKQDLDELPDMVYDYVKAICEFRLGSDKAIIMGKLDKEVLDTLDLSDEDEQSLSIDVLIKCLKKIIKSAKFWYKRNGVKGYLNYINEFIIGW